jgi:hypothetical protein
VKTGSARGRGGEGLYHHWAKPKNERVEALEPRDLAGRSLREHIRELTAATGHARFQRPVWHLWIAPNPRDRKPTPWEIDDLWRRLEREFQLEAQPFAGARHTLRREGPHHLDWSDDTHEHRAYGLVDDRGRMVDALKHERIRRQRICSEWEYDHGFAVTPLKHVRAVLRWLDEHRPEVAAALRAAGYDEDAPTRIAEIQPDARDRAERAEFKARDLHAIVLACWRSRDTAAGLEAALADFDLRLAFGRGVPVLVDNEGVVHPLRRTLAAAARAAFGSGIAEADVRARLHGHRLAPSERVKAALRENLQHHRRHEGDEYANDPAIPQALGHERHQGPGERHPPAEAAGSRPTWPVAGQLRRGAGSGNGDAPHAAPKADRTAAGGGAGSDRDADPTLGRHGGGPAAPRAQGRRASEGGGSQRLEEASLAYGLRRVDAGRRLEALTERPRRAATGGLQVLQHVVVSRDEQTEPKPTFTAPVAAAKAHRETQIDRVESRPSALENRAHEEVDAVQPPHINTEDWLQGLLGDQAYTPQPPDSHNGT